MSLFEEETGEIKAASKRLGALFGNDGIEEGNASFQYEATPTTQSSEISGRTGGGGKSSEAGNQEARELTTAEQQSYTKVAEGNRILFATTITQLYKRDSSGSEAVAYGAAGVALIEESPRNISLVVYDRKKTPFFRCVVGKDLVFLPQKSNYICIYDNSAQAWSLLFASEAESEKFAWSLTCAKMTASTLSLETSENANATTDNSVVTDSPSKDKKALSGSSDVITQDYSYSEDEKIAELGDTVQVKFSAWVNTSLQARHISQEEVLVRESTAKLEVGKTSSSIPTLVCTSITGMRRGSKRLALQATLEPDLGESDLGKVYTIQSFELTLSKIKKGKGTPRSKRGRGSTTGSFSEDAISIERKESGSSSGITRQALETVDESSASPKSDKQSLIDRMAKLSAAQNPLAASFNVFGQSRKLSSSPTASPPPPAQQSSPPDTETKPSSSHEEEVVVGAAIASPSEAASTEKAEIAVYHDQDQEEPKKPPQATEEEEGEGGEGGEGGEESISCRASSRRRSSENTQPTSTKRPGATVKEARAPSRDQPQPQPQPNQMLTQICIPPGWHYFAPPEAMAPPPTSGNEALQASVNELSSQMKQLLFAQESLRERLDQMGRQDAEVAAAESNRDDGNDADGQEKEEEHEQGKNCRHSKILESVKESFERVFAVFKRELHSRDEGTEGWESSLESTVEAAVQEELEKLENRLEE